MSEVAICNRALGKLGAETIITLDDDNKRARTMKVAFEAVRDAELRRHRYKFSIKRRSLAALAETPAFEYAYQYQLPIDYLRLIEGGDIVQLVDLTDFRGGGAALYSVEGGKILTNLPPPLKVRYIARITDASLFDACFAESLASRLAYETCELITQSDSKRQLAAADYKTALSEGIRAGAIEQATQQIADDTWVMARTL